MGAVSVSLGLFPTEPPRRIIQLIQLAEELGYARVHLGDSQMIWREAYVLLGAAALATRHITLATGVTNPVTRDPAVVAAAMVTLHELAGPRVQLGIGTGDSAVQTIGRKPARLHELEQAVGAIRRLIAGEPIVHPATGAEARIVYAPAGLRIPVVIAVSSPRIHRLAGKIADGAIVLVGIDPAFLTASRAELAAGAAEAGRDLTAAGFRVACWTPCSIQEDGRAARAAVKAHVARVLKRDLPFPLGPEDQAVVQRIRAEYEYYQHMVPGTRHGELVPDALAAKFAVAGTAREVQDQLERLAASGLVDEIVIVPHAPQPAERERIIRAVGAMLPALVRARP
ncbi:MAG TPA: LLM class flavin-dependent oxidoreductase [Chloroflexota bacterium]|nr:LLM class flavin-dependent oxidoreductase [Chloroflexota bacterium]